MKNITIKLIIVITIILQSCSQKDCSDLNESTISSCNNGLLIMKSDNDPAVLNFTLDSIQKPVGFPLTFQNIETDIQPGFFGAFTRPSNYDAYDVVNNQYYIEFPLEQRIYKYDIASQTRQELIVAGFYSAPIFDNGNLFTLAIDNFGYANDPANYTIETINTSDGSLTTLSANSFPLISPFDWESMSSASDNNGNIYFISGTNLIIYNTNTIATQHIQLVPNFDFNTNFQQFFGLEMRNNGNLLALRERDNDQDEGLELVEITINNPTETPIVVFNFMTNGIELNSEFYSTTYSACDDTYYITSRNSTNANTSDFYKIDLSTSTIETENFPYYLMGVESKNN